MPRVSIGLPVYNGAVFLAQALESLCGQTWEDLEIVICDNASTDDTPGICQSFAARDGRIRYFRNDRNLGACRNYNRTRDLARGEFFKWASHDDLCAPTLLAQCAAELDRHPEAVLAYPRTVIIDAEGRRLRLYDDLLNLTASRPSQRWRDCLFRSSQECNAVFGLIRASALRQTAGIGNFNASDRVLLAHLALLGTFIEVPAELFYRRDHAGTSLRANPTPGEVAAWFDPGRRKGRVFPTWRLFREFFGVLRSTPLPLSERGPALLQLARHLWHKRERLGMELGILSPAQRLKAMEGGS